jgi:hypothetical protein
MVKAIALFQYWESPCCDDHPGYYYTSRKEEVTAETDEEIDAIIEKWNNDGLYDRVVREDY